MKKNRLFIMGVMLVCASITNATDILTVQDVKVASGKSTVLNIEMSNTTANLMGWQCDICLPEGLTLELKANGKPTATLGDRFSSTEHTISSSCLNNGDYRFIATSMDGEAIPGTSGTLFTVTLKTDASLTPGTTLTGTIKNIEFNTLDNQKLTFNDIQFLVVIEEVRPVDTNGDGNIDATDIMDIVNYMMGKPTSTEKFNEKAADFNGDGVVNAADIIQIVNIIME